MQGQTQADIFINTLADMLEAERDIRRAQRARHHKTLAKRYIRAFPIASDDWASGDWTSGEDWTLEQVFQSGMSASGSRDRQPAE